MGHSHHGGRSPGAIEPIQLAGRPGRHPPAVRRAPAGQSARAVRAGSVHRPGHLARSGHPAWSGNSGGPGAPDLRLRRWLPRRSTIRC